MKRWTLAVALCGLAVPAFAQDVSTAQPATEKSCGEKIKEDAKYPLQLKATTAAVADMMEAHAKWIGSKTPEAKAESAMLMKLAKQHRELSRQASTAATTMQTAGNLKEAEHDMQNVPPSLITALERARDEQRRMGNLLIEGAKEMDQQINSMRGVGGAGVEGTGPEGMEMEPMPSDTDTQTQPQEGAEPQPAP